MWHWTNPHGRPGGMLLGVNLDVCDVGSIEEGDLFIKFHLRNRTDDFHRCLVAVYGAAQPEFKEKFLTELVQTYRKVSLPLLVGGILTSLGIQVRKIMIILGVIGPFYSTPLLMVWI